MENKEKDRHAVTKQIELEYIIYIYMNHIGIKIVSFLVFKQCFVFHPIRFGIFFIKQFGRLRLLSAESPMPGS